MSQDMQPSQGTRWWSRLRTQMAVKYVGVTLVFALLLEGLVLTAIFAIVTRTPVLGYFALQRAGHTAQVFALQAALQADGEALSPGTSFEPGTPASLSLRQENDPPNLSQLDLEVPYVQPGAPEPEYPVFALLIDPDGKVAASSYPDKYPEAARFEQVLARLSLRETAPEATRARPQEGLWGAWGNGWEDPDDAEIIRAALAGTPGGGLIDTPQGRRAAVARSVMSKDGKPLGAVYIQAPAEVMPGSNLLAQVGTLLVPSSVVWVCLMAPIGLLFGILTTRGMIRRIERLAGAAARFTDGDFSERVPVSWPDEIGQLEQRFNGMAKQLVDSFAQRQSLAEQSARREERARIEQEMSTARFIQQSLLPEDVPTIPGWQIQPFYRPAREVGGDLYDFLPLPDGRIGIVIGDVTGKGMPAALIMATTCAMIRAAAPGMVSPGKVLALVNNLLQVRISTGMFTTCFYAILDPHSGRLCYANAGHNIPYLAHNEDILELRATGMPLGLMPDQAYEEQEVTLEREDVILFYTDGLVEAHNPASEMFSFPRLQCLVKDHSHAAGFIENLLQALQEFTGAGWDQEDDITMVVVRRTA